MNTTFSLTSHSSRLVGDTCAQTEKCYSCKLDTLEIAKAKNQRKGDGMSGSTARS